MRVEAAAAQAAGAPHGESVLERLDVGADRRAEPSTTVAIRSDSLWRSSSAPVTTVSALGEAAEQRRRAAARRSRAAPRSACDAGAASGPWRAAIAPSGLAGLERPLLHLDRAPPCG